MKRIDNLFDKICDMDNLKLAHKNARKGKGWYKEVKEVDKNPERYLKELQDSFLNHTYHTSEYEVFYKQEGEKRRKIYKLPYFPDRIAQ
jgi:RNA-directed DNA polymerase